MYHSLSGKQDLGSQETIILLECHCIACETSLNLEAENYASRLKLKQETALRHEFQMKERQRSYEQRAALVEKGKQDRSVMQKSVESNQQQNSSAVLRQRERFREIARRRDEQRSEHAAEGRRLHSEKYGTQAGAQRSQLQAERAEQRKELGRRLAELEAQRVSEQNEGAAQRSASAMRVRAQAGFNTVQLAYEESIRQRNADAQAMRRQSQAWAESVREQREQRTTATAKSTLSFAVHERTKEEVDELKRFVPDVETIRANLRATLDRKKREAAELRIANQTVEDEAKAVLLHSARRRKAVHDWVIREKVTEVPQPQVSAGAGGIAGSRKADVAAAFAARSSLHLSKTVPVATPRADHQTAGLKFFSHAHTFDQGPLGITLGESAAGVIVHAVDKGSTAAALGVPVGGVLLAVNAQPLVRLIKSDVLRAIEKANWPVTLQVAPCLQFNFTDQGPIGLTVQDTQNGVAVWKVAEGSKAHKQGVPVGSLLVAIASGDEAPLPTAGLGRDEVRTFLLQRPLMLQVVPRDAAYLLRPKGVYRRRVLEDS